MGPRNPVGFNEECPRARGAGMGFEKLPCELGRIRCIGKGKDSKLKMWRFNFSVAAAVPPVLQAAVRAGVEDQSRDNAVRTSIFVNDRERG